MPLYADWDLLQRANYDLEQRAESCNEVLPDGCDRQSKVDRKHAVERVASKGGDWPDSWMELAERLWSDGRSVAGARGELLPGGDLNRLIRSRTWWSGACDGWTREALEEAVLVELLFYVLRNSDRWWRRPDRGESWWGFVMLYVMGELERQAAAVGPSRSELTNIHNAPCKRCDESAIDSADEGEVREELLERLLLILYGIDDVHPNDDSIMREERKVLRLHYHNEWSFAKIGQNLGLGRERVGALHRSAIMKLKRRYFNDTD